MWWTLIACVQPEVAVAAATASVGAPAPDFSLTGVDGAAFKLSEQRGKTVVLEWFNPDCPFVVYGHGATGPLATLPKTWLAKGVVWVAVNSGAAGKEGSGKERNLKAVQEYGMTYPVLLDEAGTVGKTYGAKTTPHLFIVDKAGTLVFAGGLDNAPLGDSSGAVLQPYVDQALGALLGATPVPTAAPKPYGCSVKYGS